MKKKAIIEMKVPLKAKKKEKEDEEGKEGEKEEEMCLKNKNIKSNESDTQAKENQIIHN